MPPICPHFKPTTASRCAISRGAAPSWIFLPSKCCTWNWAGKNSPAPTAATEPLTHRIFQITQSLELAEAFSKSPYLSWELSLSQPSPVRAIPTVLKGSRSSWAAESISHCLLPLTKGRLFSLLPHFQTLLFSPWTKPQQSVIFILISHQLFKATESMLNSCSGVLENSKNKDVFRKQPLLTCTPHASALLPEDIWGF